MKKYLIIIFIILIFICLSGGVFVPREINSEKKVIFEVERGWGVKEIASNLEKEELIWWSPVFRVYVLVSGKARKLQAGFYSLSPSMNIPQIAAQFTSGNVLKEKLVVPEGFTSKQIFQRLNETRFDLVSLELLEKNEGYLFPDTYEIAYGTPMEGIIRIMKENFDKKTANLEITREVVIMASLLEKEVRTPEDKKLVSGILWKRLAANIPLQVDATIAYVLDGEEWTFDEMRREIAAAKDIDSPYNTYKYRGLPFGPICNPGLDSMMASLYPEESEYWYYLSTPEGETIFSKTLEGHNIAKARYLK